MASIAGDIQKNQESSERLKELQARIAESIGSEGMDATLVAFARALQDAAPKFAEEGWQKNYSKANPHLVRRAKKFAENLEYEADWWSIEDEGRRW